MALSTLRAPKRARRGGVPTPSGMPNNVGMNPLMMMLNPMANPMAMMGQSMNPMAALMGQAMNPGHQVVPMDEGEGETESEPEVGSRAAGQSQSSGHRPSMTSQSSGSVEGAAAIPRPVEPDVPIYPVVRPDDPAQEEFNARRQAENFISRNVTYIKNIPRQHLAVCMEYINPRLDMSFMSECSANGLLALLWLYCRIKPCIRVLTDLRCSDLLTNP